MPNRGDWLPTGREKQLAMVKTWLVVLATKGVLWNIPAAEITELQTLATAADAILTVARSSERTPIVTAQCKTAFDALVAKMRFFKNHYFLSPPLTDADFIALGLKPKDTTHTPIPEPTAQAEADVSRPGVHLLELHLRAVSGAPPDPYSADYGYRIYYGVMPQGGASVDAATGAKRELMRAPLSGEELPHSRFTNRKKERFDFSAEDSGKTVFFCVCYENSKGDPGPWGPLFSAIIP